MMTLLINAIIINAIIINAFNQTTEYGAVSPTEKAHRPRNKGWKHDWPQLASFQ